MRSSVIIALLFFALGCNNTSNYPTEQEVSRNLKTYLALGDSYTIGESVEIIDRWPIQLVDKLNKNKPIISSPEIIAQTGWTTDELLQNLGSRTLGYSYNLVSLLIGVNNQYRGRSEENFKIELNLLLDLAIGYAANRKEKVFVLSIPDWGVMPFARDRNRRMIASEIDRFNQILEQECRKKGITFFNITTISRDAANTPEFVAQDGLHPSGEMYAQWVEHILPSINAILDD